MARLLLQKLSKTFTGPAGQQIRAVTEVDLAIEDRELLVLLGPSGAGKTVLLRLIAGLERPSAGTILLGLTRLEQIPARERDIGMVFQANALYPHLNAADNIGFGLRLRHVPRAEAARRVREVAELLGISDCLQRRPAELSGGQRQRVALGRVLVRKPAIVLFDEPFSNLDAQLRFELRDELMRLQAIQGWTGIYVTHDQAEAMALGQRTAVMRLGRVQQTGMPHELYLRPANRFVAEFLGSPPMNFLKVQLLAREQSLCFQRSGTKESAVVVLPDNTARRLNQYAGKEVLLGLRPEHILARHNVSPAAEREVAGRVGRVQWLGTEAHLEVRSDDKLLWVRADAGGSFHPGDPVLLSLVVDAAHFFEPATERAL